MIVAGYLLTYAARAQSGNILILKISRYHLFPQIGLICLIVATLGGFSRRQFDARPDRGLLAGDAASRPSWRSSQYPGMQAAAEGPFRFPDQPRLLSAATRLEEVARRGASRSTRPSPALDPIRTRWSPQPWPFNPLLNSCFRRGPSEAPKMADSSVRDAIIASLSPGEREVIFGGMEASRYRRPIPPSEGRESLDDHPARGHLSDLADRGGSVRSPRWPGVPRISGRSGRRRRTGPFAARSQGGLADRGLVGGAFGALVPGS